MKKYLLYVIELMKAFWNSSITIMWAFVPLLLLMTYKVELLNMDKLLFDLRIFLIGTWKYFWIAFFISNSYIGIKEIKGEPNE